MSLRILLADESTSIKKAFQLALSDLGVEIKSVPSGLDVLTVAIDFKPTLVFADILLTKKSGYEICTELKEHIQTRTIPVVLMWSQFMEFNQTLAEKARFDDKLEKPFDTETLRKIVLRFYNEAETHPLKNKIQFPSFSDFDEDFKPVQLNNKPEMTSYKNYPPVENIEHIDDLDEVEESGSLEIKNLSPASIKNNDSSIYLETESYGDFEEVILIKSPQQRTEAQKNISKSPSPINTLNSNLTSQISSQVNTQVQSNLNAKLSTQMNENLVREEVRILTEKICWQIIPDLAEKIIKEEIQKLMKNIEKSL